jgi:glutamyl-tRNA synthetase
VPAYQLAVVVDDIAMGITEVVRGDDLLPSTHRQVLLYTAFGAPPPRYLHLPLVVGDDGVRLAKRHGSIAIAELRRRGVAPARLRQALLESLGVRGDLRTGRLEPAAIPRGPLALASLRRAVPEIG